MTDAESVIAKAGTFVIAITAHLDQIEAAQREQERAITELEAEPVDESS